MERSLGFRCGGGIMRSEKKIDLSLIRRKTFSLGLLVPVFAMSAFAASVTTSTPAGSTTSGPVAASATFVTGGMSGGTGFINITLNDLEGNPTDVAQLLSGLSFTLSNGVTSGTLFQSQGTQVTVNSGGTYSVG